MLHEHQVLFQAGEKEFVRSQMHSELQSYIVSYQRQQEEVAKNLEYQEAQLRVQL